MFFLPYADEWSSRYRTVDMRENWYGMMVESLASTIVSLLTPEYQSTVVGTANWDQAEWSKKSYNNAVSIDPLATSFGSGCDNWSRLRAAESDGAGVQGERAKRIH